MPPKGHWGAYWQWGMGLWCPGKLFLCPGGLSWSILTPRTHRNAATTSDSGSSSALGAPSSSQIAVRVPIDRRQQPQHTSSPTNRPVGSSSGMSRTWAHRAHRAGVVAAASVIEPMPTHGNWRAVKSHGRRFLQASLRSAPEGPSLSGERADVGLAVLRAVRMGMDGRSTRKETRAARGGSVG